MPGLKKYSPLYNRILLLLVVILLACGPDYPGNYFPGYFMPQSGRTPAASARYYFSPAFLYETDENYWDYRDYRPEPDQNLAAWEAYCGVDVSDSMAGRLIYQGKDDPANPLYAALLKKPAARRYLLLARNIQNASAAGGTPWDPVPADTAAMKQYFTTVCDSLHAEKDPFLKDKYAFQAVKLAHQLHDNDSCIALYDAYFGGRADSSVMKWWSLSHKAGALLGNGDTTQAVYTFAQVFDRCISRRQAAYMSLRMYGIRFVPAALQYCKNDREKAAVYTLCAIQPWQDALPLMEDLVKTDPGNAYLELIMGREINKNERFYYNDKRNPDYYYRMDTTGAYKAREKASSYFERLGRFALECAGNAQVKDHAFWNTAAAYICYIQGDFDEAHHLLKKAGEEVSGNPVLSQQIRLQKLLLATGETQEITPALEKKVLPMLTALKKTADLDFYQNDTGFYKVNALATASHRLGMMYKSLPATSGRSRGWWRCNRPDPLLRGGPGWGRAVRYAPAKALLLSMAPYFWNVPDTTSDALLENLIQFYSQPDPSKEDSLFMQLTDLNLNNFYLLKGRRALSRFHYKEAAGAWQHVADTFWQDEPFRTYLAANPFASHVKDTHAPTKADTIRYTPYQFARRMLQLSAKATQDPDHAAKYYYLLGCAAYNMSYYGNSWLLVKDSRSSAELPYSIEQPMKPADSINYYTTAKAMAYFDSAVQAAGTKSELAARACFMAAKCEQNAFYVYCSIHEDLWRVLHPYRYGYMSSDVAGKYKDSLSLATARRVRDEDFHHYFNLLKNKYSASQFNREVIRECAVYRDFIQGK